MAKWLGGRELKVEAKREVWGGEGGEGRCAESGL